MSVVRIAAKAGVSIATVSRVLNNSRRVNPRLADQVHEAMRQLNVSPGQIRRRSPNRRAAGDEVASTIAIIAVGQRYTGWFEIPAIAAVVAEITRAAVERNLGTLITELVDPQESSPLLRRQQIDGAIVLLDSALPPRAAAHLGDQLPVVRVMGGQMSPLVFDHVAPDNPAIGYLACQTLLERGCDTLFYLTTRPAWDFSMLRGQGFAAAALAVGKRTKVFIEQAGDASNFEAIYGPGLIVGSDLPALVTRLAEAVRGHSGGKLGLFISRDEETVLVYRMLAELGVRPGEQFVVISCDNEQVRLAGLNPPPMSIGLNAPQIAHHAVARLAHRMRHRSDPPVRMLISPEAPRSVAEGNGHASPVVG